MFLRDWATELGRPHSTLSRSDFPFGLMDSYIDSLLRDLSGSNADQTASILRNVKSLLRQIL